MDTQSLIYGALLLGAGNIIALITFWMKLGERLKAGEDARMTASTAIAQIKLLEERFADYREKAAKEFLTDRALIDAENRMTRSVEDLRTDMREHIGTLRDEMQGMNARFDKFMQAELERARSRD